MNELSRFLVQEIVQSHTVGEGRRASSIYQQLRDRTQVRRWNVVFLAFNCVLRFESLCGSDEARQAFLTDLVADQEQVRFEGLFPSYFQIPVVLNGGPSEEVLIDDEADFRGKLKQVGAVGAQRRRHDDIDFL